MNNDSSLDLALNLRSLKGGYALLLGSGISRSAGIPTGWDIVIDLIKQLAVLLGEKIGSVKPEEWYRSKFGEEADYSRLLEKLSGKQTERMNIVRKYFEPTEEESGQGIKVPTEAHRAIAKLVKKEYIRMIITTNFDRLLEKALEDEGITPDVIASEDGINGTLPYVHSKCVLAKINGDYRDPRIKNTISELKTYSKNKNSFLNRIFDEFGLIVCGWSATWDIALRNAILRCPNRRFSTF
ncbi:MAG: sirT4 [Firmicutes bacterium]|nr:sirT4 [Bacillota bacterium]